MVEGNVLTKDMSRIEDAVRLMKALSHPMRLQLVAIISEGEINVSELADRLNEHPSVVSQQLRILRLEGLVNSKRSNGYSYYTITDKRMPEFMDYLEKVITAKK